MNYQIELTKFQNELNVINNSTNEIINQANASILLSRNTLSNLKKIMFQIGFKTVDDEIHFFKVTKQVPLIQIVYYTEIRNFELNLPKGSEITQQAYIHKKLTEIDQFFVRNIHFNQYVICGHTHSDKLYFTRSAADKIPYSCSDLYFRDPEFSTAYDMLLAKHQAFLLVVDHLKYKLTGNKSKTPNIIPLKWTATKNALTELIYGLHQSGALNNGNSTLKDIVHSFQIMFSCDLGNIYQKYAEMKYKNNELPTFLSMMTKRFLNNISDPED
ncbi:tetracycline resistance element mobilization reg ulatory protein RteC [Formosa agariphila KMM 3901]|uniref:Tetracycline resistance element mobilization reg ulatory protein RteC n=1 Tax=Formosa agariphila (strain DSM 15362 / KCTC 12365 / LMG 23005 / KMM 3901 / M-2Alg 35-1) TaxID=1347342 RepID=T2KQR1_FORAG|nr:RteC domain-containing protein [Formosa agariphila]CDF80833.1 tetracycline resistance element mobilization reg ulatory protein RteC [Formosa agariphila KMM 3901]